MALAAPLRPRTALPRSESLSAAAWERRHRLLHRVLAVHAVVLPAVVAAGGYGAGVVLATALPLLALALLASRPGLSRAARSGAVALGLLAASALLAGLTGGVAEARLHLFAAVVALALYEDWRPLAVAAGYALSPDAVVAAAGPDAAAAGPWSEDRLPALLVTGIAATVTVGLWLHARLRAEARESAEGFRLAFEHAPVAMFVVGADPARFGRILRLNHAAERMLGLPAEEIRRLGWPALTHPDDLEMGRVLAARLASGAVDRVEQEKRYLRPDGQVVWARVTGALVRDEAGAPSHWISQVEDITQRRLAERDVACQYAVTDCLARAVSIA